MVIPYKLFSPRLKRHGCEKKELVSAAQPRGAVFLSHGSLHWVTRNSLGHQICEVVCYVDLPSLKPPI